MPLKGSMPSSSKSFMAKASFVYRSTVNMSSQPKKLQSFRKLCEDLDKTPNVLVLLHLPESGP